MDCFITHTATYLPGEPVGNDSIELHLGRIDGEYEIRDHVLRMN